jgi:hypothetical protein
VSTHKLWELLAFLVIIGIIAKIAIAFLTPLVPFIVVGVVVVGLGAAAYNRSRTW